MSINLCKWPIKFLQEKLLGIYAGDLWIIGAFSGCGKSTLARQITMSAHKSGVPVVLYSLENQPGTYVSEEVRVLYNEETGSRLEMRAFKDLESQKPEMFQKYRMQLYENSKAVNEDGLKLLIVHEDVKSQNMSVNDLLKSIDQEYEKGYRLFIIDHVDMLITDPKYEMSQTTENMNKLWAYVAQKNIALITFSQMATSIQSSVLCPGESDLRGVRTKGQRATGVITLAKHDYGLYAVPGHNFAFPTYVRIAKNRDGATGCAVCFFETDHYLDDFEELSCDKQGILVGGMTKEKLIRFKQKEDERKKLMGL